jgi:hypothetical protein
VLFPQSVVLSPQAEDSEEKKDIFASRDDDSSVDGELDEQDAPAIKLPDAFEELPIEIRSLTERWENLHI